MDTNFNIMNYKKYCEDYQTDKINEIALEISKMSKSDIEDNLLNSLFKYGENMDILIIKIMIFSDEDLLSSLFEFFECDNYRKLNKHYYNTIGKYVTLNIGKKWDIVYQYIYSNSLNVNYSITRILYYLSKFDSDDLKKCLNVDDFMEIYNSEELYEQYSMDKIEDSDYMSNEDEFKYSLEKIIKKLLKYKLKYDDYLDKYKNSFFTGNAYIENILERIEKEKNVKSRQKRYCILSEKGNAIIGDNILKLKESFEMLKYKKKNTDYMNWLNEYTNCIYDIILKYGEDVYEECFFLDNVLYGGWATELLFRCKILNKETERKALKIIKELIDNNYKDLSIVEVNVFRNLLQYTNLEAIKIFGNRLKDSIDSNLTVENNTFHFLLGICERYFGTYEMAKFAYSSKRQQSGQYWEQIVGKILPLIYSNKEIRKHFILDNNLIPDYMINENDYEKNIIIECKLTLGFREVEETLKKYSNYSKNIYFYCFKNRFENEDYYSKEYLELKEKYKNNIEILDYDIIKQYVDFDNKEEFKDATNKISQKNVLKNEVIFDSNFSNDNKELIIETLNKVWGKSTLF